MFEILKFLLVLILLTISLISCATAQVSNSDKTTSNSPVVVAKSGTWKVMNKGLFEYEVKDIIIQQSNVILITDKNIYRLVR